MFLFLLAHLHQLIPPLPYILLRNIIYNLLQQQSLAEIREARQMEVMTGNLSLPVPCPLYYLPRHGQTHPLIRERQRDGGLLSCTYFCLSPPPICPHPPTSILMFFIFTTHPLAYSVLHFPNTPS